MDLMDPSVRVGASTQVHWVKTPLKLFGFLTKPTTGLITSHNRVFDKTIILHVDLFLTASSSGTTTEKSKERTLDVLEAFCTG